MNNNLDLLDINQSIAIVVTYNPDIIEFMKFCNILSVQFSSILIVDNCSSNVENLMNNLKEINCFQKINFIFNKVNKGLAFAQNQGVDFAQKNSFKSFCMFDQDSMIDSDYLFKIIKDYNFLVQNGHFVGSIGPSICDQTSGNIYPAVVYNGFFLNRFSIDRIRECSYIIASGSLTSISAFNKVGLFLDYFFINYIDVEWCFRSISKGFKIYITPNVILYQNVGIYRKTFFGRAIPVHNPLRRYYASRNSTLMLSLKHVSIGYKFREILFNPLRLIFDCIFAGDVILRIKLFTKGFFDAIKK